MNTATNPPEPAHELPRALGYTGSTAIVIGTIIGSGIFLVPHDIALQVGSVRALMLVWLIGGVLSLAGALSLAELGAANPSAGGIYVYLRDAYGRLFAFLYGWALLLVINSGSLATLAVAFGIYSTSFLPLSPLEQKLVASGVIALLTLVNILGVRKASAVQTLFTVAKLAGLATIMGAAFFSSHVAPAQTDRALPLSHATASSFGVAMIGILWAYEGWHMLSFAAGEVKNPTRVLPRSYLVGTVVVVAVYLGANLAYLRVLPLPEMALHQRVAATAMELLAGPRGATFVSALILCSIFGAINGTVLGGPRAYFAMARDGVFFPSVGKVHPRYRTPAAALLIQGVWAILLASSGTYKQLYTYVIFTGWLFYASATFAVVVLRRKRPDLSRPYRVWGFPVVPLVFSAAALAIVGNALIRSPLESGIGLALVLAGVPIFLIWQRRAKQKAVIPLLDKEGSGVVDRGVITPTASSCEGGESSGNKRERGD
ncbi:MAG: amino acid permease [Terriglobia bacterium]|jgi:APA family basic amino acid/polyamine antiporter